MDFTKLWMLHSHSVAADAIYATRHAAIPGAERVADEHGEDAVELGKMVSGFYRMLIFYAMVYVVVEAYRELDERSDEIDKLIDGGPVDDLRRLRNAVCHVQDEPFTPKIWDFLHKAGSEKWIYQVHRGLERFLFDRLSNDKGFSAWQAQHAGLPNTEQAGEAG